MKERIQSDDFKLVDKDEASEDEQSEDFTTDSQPQQLQPASRDSQTTEPPVVAETVAPAKTQSGLIVAALMLILAGGAYWSAGMPALTISQMAIIIITAVAGIIDWRTKKIFNVITFPAAALGIGLNAMTGGWQAALMAVAGWFLAAIIMVAPDHLIMKKPKMYFGDAKLMAAIGAFLGPGGMLIAYFYFSLIYGVVAITRISVSFPWKEFSNALKLGLSPESALDDSKLVKARQSKIALGPYIALGTFLSIVLQQQTLGLLGFHDTALFGFPMILGGGQ